MGLPLVCLILMFIGGSPMSIAGGIKTTTFFVLLLILFKNQDQNGNIIYREKKITTKILSKAVRIALMAVSLLFVGTVLIYIFEGEIKVANIKSAKKRILVTDKKTEENKSVNSAMKTAIKKFLAAVEAGNKEEATALYSAAVSAIDGAASEGLFHKNRAANKKSNLAKKLAAM